MTPKRPRDDQPSATGKEIAIAIALAVVSFLLILGMPV